MIRIEREKNPNENNGPQNTTYQVKEQHETRAENLERTIGMVIVSTAPLVASSS